MLTGSFPMRTARFRVVRARLHEFFGHSLSTPRPAAIIGAIGVQTISHVYRFGPFELDPGRRLLVRGDEAIWLPDRQMDVLLFLVPRAGHLVQKEALFEAAWRGVAVGDNSIAQAVHGLRDTLGDQEDGSPHIETLRGKGYRFRAPVECGPAHPSNITIEALLAQHRGFIDGAALERLDLDAAYLARTAFREGVLIAPYDPKPRVGLANACALIFESTRVDIAPDVDTLQEALRSARAACELDSYYAEGWSALAFVLHRCGHAPDAIAAARNAIEREPDNWRHHLRLAFVSSGEMRLRAARRVLELRPGLALAHWFAATVFVGRGSFGVAIKELRAGCVSQDAQSLETGRFNAVGLHLLLGLVLAAQGDLDGALEEFSREIALLHPRRVYARECGATTYYAIAAVRLRQGRRDEAETAFREALTLVPGHPCAAVGLAAIVPSFRPEPRQHDPNSVDAAIVRALVLALQGRHDEGARLCLEALLHAAPGSDGWLLPVDPLLQALAHPDAWTKTLATLADRAS